MIIFDGEKYSCVSCIRGHRSTTCKHSNRMLVKVRTKGRPSAKTIRKVILVDASSQVNNSPILEEQSSTSCCSSSRSRSPRSCTKMNKQPILFLRAMSTQKAFLVDGALKIVIEDKDTTSQGEMKLVSERDYLLNHLKIPTPNLPKELHSHYGVQSDGNLSSFMEPLHHQGPLINTQPVKQEFAELDFQHQIDRCVAPPTYKNSQEPYLGPSVEADYTSAEIHNNSFVELFTHKGVYLSTQCNCEDDNCQCVNCLIHRKEEELESYVKQSGVPLSNVGNGRISFPDQQPSSDALICKSPAHHCETQDCLLHPAEIVPFNNIFMYGLVNISLKPKSVIKYKHKLIPSRFWWNLLKEELPVMSQEECGNFDLMQWFENTIHSFDMEIPNEYDGGSSSLHGIGLMTTS
ncbi:LANO_0D04258g1_1 [Lachancea nothofagi CBS 11611]|uniref:LANO_0D04258g1_1 n=1 Tax=Lachancea nothofagi CBS 11611 TaxID=1266666 RepID=A0A1G4JFX6_9SACH|nr:LANO_0D04258g1_1 [Lachancea nothofagi CBS 11611]